MLKRRPALLLKSIQGVLQRMTNTACLVMATDALTAICFRLFSAGHNLAFILKERGEYEAAVRAVEVNSFMHSRQITNEYRVAEEKSIVVVNSAERMQLAP